jgi:hypothetical protein
MVGDYHAFIEILDEFWMSWEPRANSDATHFRLIERKTDAVQTHFITRRDRVEPNSKKENFNEKQIHSRARNFNARPYTGRQPAQGACCF